MNRMEALFWQLYNKGFSPAFIRLRLEIEEGRLLIK